MKKILTLMIALSIYMNAYTIHGEYFTLDRCEYTKMGYDYGYVGTYSNNSGEVYKIFFGDDFCEY